MVPFPTRPKPRLPPGGPFHAANQQIDRLRHAHPRLFGRAARACVDCSGGRRLHQSRVTDGEQTAQEAAARRLSELNPWQSRRISTRTPCYGHHGGAHLRCARRSICDHRMQRSAQCLRISAELSRRACMAARERRHLSGTKRCLARRDVRRRTSGCRERAPTSHQSYFAQ